MQRVAVLYNRDYSPDLDDYAARADVEKTAHAVVAAIDASSDYRAELVAVEGSSLQFVDVLQKRKPDLVFNLCETLAGRAENEVLVPALLDLLAIPYTGNGVLTLATALRKDRTKELLRSRRVPTPAAITLDRAPSKPPSFGFPAIVKPNGEDGSLGISMRSVVSNLKSLQAQVRTVVRRYHGPALVEQFVQGREVMVPLLVAGDGFEALPWSEIDFSDMPAGLHPIVTYKGKWDEGSDDYRGSTTRLNPKLGAPLRERILRAASEAFSALECRGYARVDLRVSKRGVPYVIDVNPNCDLSPGGGFFRACKATGMSYADMALKLLRTI